MRLDRQSTTVPNTSNVSALTSMMVMSFHRRASAGGAPAPRRPARSWARVLSRAVVRLQIVLVPALVVGAEHVGAEVVSGIVPHRMHMVRAVLRVVVLDQQRGAAPRHVVP